MIKNIKILLTAGIILASLILAVVGWIVLPDTLVLQVTFSGAAGTTLPKPIGIAIPLLVSVIFSVLHYFSDNKRHLMFSLLGLVFYIFVFLFN